MISRLFVKDGFGFNEIELEFSAGLNVFTGISGAGKSVLMNFLLAVFGLKEANANLIEVQSFCKLNLDDILEEEPNTFKLLKQNNTRYFLNSQNISKKRLNQAVESYIKFLSAKENKEFENFALLELIDATIENKNFHSQKNNLREIFTTLQKKKQELDEILSSESKIEELKEFTIFEIEKISKINPKIGELEELSELKKKLSKKDKIQTAWQNADKIFDIENAVIKALELSDIDSAFFSDTMNELRSAKESVSFDEFSDEEIENILNRIENLSQLERRYESIENALAILEKKKLELEHYEKIEFKKDELSIEISSLQEKADEISAYLHKERKTAILVLEKIINEYLNKLYLDNLSLNLKKTKLSIVGYDEVIINLNQANFKDISSGELNRLRLAFIAVKTQLLGSCNCVLFLDEIDANLSGKEAMSIAGVLSEIAKKHQIFAISHQPQLSSKADKHFLVEKHQEISNVKELSMSQRELELARMISGEQITKEAKEFAKKLLN